MAVEYFIKILKGHGIHVSNTSIQNQTDPINERRRVINPYGLLVITGAFPTRPHPIHCPMVVGFPTINHPSPQTPKKFRYKVLDTKPQKV